MKVKLTAAKSKEKGVEVKSNTVNERARGQRKDNEEIEALRFEINATIKKNNKVTMGAVGGMNDVKEALLDAILLPKKSAQRPGLVLLYGPSGTGKTHIVSAVAHCSDCTLFSVKASDIGSKWYGESEKKVTILFEEAKKQHYSIIFIDELDCICSNRDRSRNEYGRKVLTSFLTEINRIGDDINNVAVMAATNRPWDLDRAVQDRFDTKIYVPLPDLETRKSILKLQMNGHRNSLTDDNFQHVAQLTHGATAREVGSLVKKAYLASMKGDTYVIVHGKYRPTSRCCYCPQHQEGSKAKCQRCGAIRISPYDVPDGSLECRSVQMNDISKNLKSSYCSVTDEMRQRYEEWHGN
eukprot:scaffold19360_cov80-Skeletonema_menzelii.AAC.2